MKFFDRLIVFVGSRNILPIKDKLYLSALYKLTFGKKIDFENPVSFNEKLQWLKLYDRKPLYTTLVDKYAVKQFIADKIGSEYVIPTLGVWNKFDDIDFTKLPNQFVLKCTHDSGGIVIVKDKNKLDIEAAKKKIESSLKANHYLKGREWVYKNVPKKIIAEKYISNEDESDLVDYKLMCFNGKHLCTFTCTDRFSDTGLKVTFFDKEWKKMPFERHYPSSNEVINKPLNYEKMSEIAEILSENIPFVRVDLYDVNGQILFGEMTFFPGNGLEEFRPEDADVKMGRLIKLPKRGEHL